MNAPPATPGLLDDPLPALEEAALDWVVRLHSGSATAAERAAYAAWKAASPEQNAAALTAEALWEGLGKAAKPRRRRALLRGAGAGAVILGLLALGAGSGFLDHPATLLADHRTGIGERRSLILPDGSRLDLDSATSLDVAFDARRRRIRLHDGRIHAEVAADPDRPFEVEAAGGRVLALGTGFDLRRDGDAVQVVVTEHSVELAIPGQAPLQVAAGQRAGYGPGRLDPPAPADLRSETAWRRGQLIFHGRPLGEVAAEMGRYNRGWIVFTDATLRRRPVTGVFPTNDPAAFFDAIAAALPVRLRRLPWLTIVEPDPMRAGRL
ncbi:FecR family protein [Plastoroseomonas hellenica]|uniref:FecR family protein n=1 Tax=Plastoroseomonas hellenica TaxID=2687306 RepID=UPI001BA54B7C|nr:FecR domain-containing protein [Plastoroseomonas hellenica]MBR0644208.1 DUF4880 domain-containing protein [Plastoroseomonas hellenica]